MNILMCPPDYFGIEYSINPWMDTHNQSDSDTAKQQWQKLYQTFIDLGHDVKLMTPQQGLPDLVYVDAGVVYKDIFIPSNFYYPERQKEREHFVQWFKDNGFTINEVSEEKKFEGHGDTLFAGNKLFCGTGFRSSQEAHKEIQKILGDDIEVHSIELTDNHFYHLDTCFCPLNDRQAMIYPNGVSKKSLRLLETHLELIEVNEADAQKFACNAVVLDKDIILPQGARKTCTILNKMGYSTHEIPMTEFIKGGGACKCLSLPLPI